MKTTSLQINKYFAKHSDKLPIYFFKQMLTVCPICVGGASDPLSSLPCGDNVRKQLEKGQISKSRNPGCYRNANLEF